MPPRLDESLARWQAASQAFRELVLSVPAPQATLAGVSGIWSVKQIVAHIAGWQREAYRRFQDYQRGLPVTEAYDDNAFNASSVNALRLLNWRETLETYEQTQTDLANLALSLHEEEADRAPYSEWLWDLANDLDEHGQEIRAWLAAQRP
jgi:hypothetical protein